VVGDISIETEIRSEYLEGRGEVIVYIPLDCAECVVTWIDANNNCYYST